MRLGVLDVGSNTVHMLVVDAERGRPHVPVANRRSIVRLMRFLEPDGSIGTEGIDLILAGVRDGRELAREHGIAELLVLVTSAIREAPNGGDVIARIEEILGERITILSGEQEAALTFLAARRWHGWGAGRILLLDIGGGSLEVAYGIGEVPDVAFSLPLGAGRSTIQFLDTDVSTPEQVEALRHHARAVLADALGALDERPRPDHVVATSKTFRSLARLAGMQVEAVGPDDRWRLRRSMLADWVPRLARLTAQGRTELPGITPERTYQIVGGAIVAEEAMRALKVAEVEICPWAMREGAILRRTDTL